MRRQSRYEEDGFVAVPGFCDEEELHAIESALNRFIGEVLPNLPPEEVFYEDKADLSTLKQIQRMQVHDEFFASFMESSPKALAEELLGEPVIAKTCSTSTNRLA